MPPQTRKTSTYYSRDNYKKKQLQTNINSPHWGNSTCQLCEDGGYPFELNKYVGNYTTCADIHLKMSLLQDTKEQCSSLQSQYRSVCCDAPSGWKLPTVSLPDNMGTSMIALAGVVVFGVCARKLISSRRSRSKYDKRLPETIADAAATPYKRMKDRPGATSPSRRAYSPSRKSSRSRSKERRTASPLRMGYSPSRTSSKKNKRTKDRPDTAPPRTGYSPSRKSSKIKKKTKSASPLVLPTQLV